MTHPLYEKVNNLKATQLFTMSHAFAVWDFMCLLKCLQRKLTCTDVLWIPPKDVAAARLINEIVLGEECDQVSATKISSHYNLYLQAMSELKADTRPISALVDAIANKMPLDKALRQDIITKNVPQATTNFVRDTLSYALSETKEVHEIAAYFLLGREDPIPQMFQKLLDSLPELSSMHKSSESSFVLYLERHIEVDADTHAPMGQKLLENLCGNDEKKWMEATESANKALASRIRLWDGICSEIDRCFGKTCHADLTTDWQVITSSLKPTPQGAIA
jgi:hypothetical protein